MDAVPQEGLEAPQGVRGDEAYDPAGHAGLGFACTGHAGHPLR